MSLTLSSFGKNFVNNSTSAAAYTLRKDGVVFVAYSNGLTSYAVVEDGRGNEVETLQCEPYFDDEEGVEYDTVFVPSVDFSEFGYELIKMGID